MATFFGQTVDVHEDFEDALSGDWALTQTDDNIVVNSSAAKKNGSYGLLVNDVGTNTETAELAHARYNYGSTIGTKFSVGFWIKIPTYEDTTQTNHLVFVFGHSTPGTHVLRCHYTISSNVISMYIYGVAGGPAKTLSGPGWYWITIEIEKNAACQIRIYNESHQEVDADTDGSCTGVDADRQYFFLGNVTAPQASPVENVDWYFDDFVIDVASPVYPLLAWTTGSALPIILQQMM